jgi:precorrin-6Y C5,15-methyltransferase (decarboxylating)
MEKNKIKIIGLDASTTEISPEKLKSILSSDVLVGGKRHLALFKEYKGTTLPVTGHISALLDDISKHHENGANIAVLASGDPLLFGIGNTLVENFGVDMVDIIPGISSVQASLSRLGLKTDNVVIINKHAGSHETLDSILYHTVSVILTSDRFTPAEAIHEFTENHPDSLSWNGNICECMGIEQEHVYSGTLKDLLKIKDVKMPNLLVIENPEKQEASQGSACFGRADSDFEHDANMITHPEIRAVTLSKLALGKSKVMWDIGAGSGSVGIESALLSPLLKVYCVEKNSERIERVIKNKEKHDATNLNPVHGNAIDICHSLPAPDRVFFGGGGNDLYALLTFSYKVLKKNGIMVINTVTMEAFETARSFCMSEAKEFELIELQVSKQHSFSGYHMLKPDNPVSIFTVKK